MRTEQRDYILPLPKEPVIPVTDYVDRAEGCLRLWEEDRWVPMEMCNHRFQMIAVVRGDRPAVYTKDLGPSKNFTGLPFQACGAVKSDTGHTFLIDEVGFLMDKAEEYRNTPPPHFAQGFLVYDIVGAFQDEVQRSKDILLRRKGKLCKQ